MKRKIVIVGVAAAVAVALSVGTTFAFNWKTYCAWVIANGCYTG